MSLAIFVLIIVVPRLIIAARARARVQSFQNDSLDPNSRLYRHSCHAHAWSRWRVSRLHIIIPHGYSSSNPELCLQLDYRMRSPSLSIHPFLYQMRVVWPYAHLFQISLFISLALSFPPFLSTFNLTFTVISNYSSSPL